MSMTAAEIMEVVGKDQQPWWPPLMWGDGEWWTRAEAKHVMPDLAELAFIGAAVRELANRGDASEDDINRYTCPTLLHALVAALNESEGA